MAMTPDRQIKEKNGFTDETLLRLFLKLGSVESVLESFPNINVSYATYQRLISDRGIIKSPTGRPPVHIGALTDFFQTMITENSTIERLNKYPISGFVYGERSLYRVLKKIRTGVISHNATMILAHPQYRPDLLLTARDLCINSVDVEHSRTAPMTYSTKKEDPYFSLLRVVQQEMLSEMTINGELNVSKASTHRFLKNALNPKFYVDVLDVRVGVHILEIPTQLLSRISSERLDSMHFESLYTVAQSDPVTSEYRAGVVDAARKHVEAHLSNEEKSVGNHFPSQINRSLYATS
jgi:hypothetical protein